ncbi:uncharacterized protein F5891DRAFT_987922 [Suillus fuscotomentosus]|uniref:Uncharacterized protein n=1 Tax=Suillus fuscotomentosus TaxID=1912939 RepID=A0AAD4DPH7_9AGAM|nr:uncharacterized protein F5891DRAFT_987922 [Suillus fuscotomentosus]KAG1888012.1 hypothetical protein F5891DRAFT_987922 [Suillus fuscotomentosus]
MGKALQYIHVDAISMIRYPEGSNLMTGLLTQHEQPEPQLEAPSQDGLEDADESHRKRKRSEDNGTPCNLGRDVTNARATSVPIIELPPEKRRKIGIFEGRLVAKVMQEVVGVHEAMSRIETIINRQNEVLHEICNAIENHGM